MPVLTANELSKSYGPRVLLDSVNLAIRTGEHVGLVGSNGSGKSTLARIIAGLDTPDGGTLAVRRGAEILYLEQEPTLDPNATARETVEAGLAIWHAAIKRHEDACAAAAVATGRELDKALAEQSEAEAEIERRGGWDRTHLVDRMLEGLSVRSPEKRMSELSGGEKRRVALARILVAEPALAILDEPTNHLDIDTIEWLEVYLRESFKGALLLVTHDRYFLDRLVDRTLEIENGSVYSYDGGWDAFLEAKAMRAQHEAREEANRQNFLRTELEWLRRSPQARTTKQKARVERAEAAVNTAKPREERTVALALESSRSGKTILDLRDLDVTQYGHALVKNLSIALVQGDRIGVVGPNGAGKTTLLRVMLGDLPPTRGEVVLGQNTKVAYFDQGRTGLDDDASIQENVVGDRTRVEIGGETLDVRTYLARFLFSSHRLREKVAGLSGGERARVAIARLLLSPANLLVLDEPTNDLDVQTLSALEQMIVEAEATALIVSHDRYFLDRVATGILAFEGDGRVVLHAGNYDDYKRAKKREREAQMELAAAEKATAKVEKQAAAAQKKSGLSYKERIELERIMPDIEAAEAKLATLEKTLADPDTYAKRSGDVPMLMASRDAAKLAVDTLVARWEDLEARANA